MSTQIIRPDMQTLYLDALIERAYKAFDELGVDPDEVAYVVSDEPESHVFSAWDDEGAYDDLDEYRDVVNMVGERDLDDKIRHWERVLDELDERAS